MKIRLSNILFALLCIMLLGASLCIGAVRGWSMERSEVLSSLGESGELRMQLEYRGMDAANLAVVAARHLPAHDANLVALRQASGVLLSGNDDVQALLEADAAITDVARAFATQLPLLPTVAASQRDTTYVCTLTSALGKMNSLTHTYSVLTEDFNQRITSSLTGRLAMLLGVDPLPAPTAQ